MALSVLFVYGTSIYNPRGLPMYSLAWPVDMYHKLGTCGLPSLMIDIVYPG